MSPLSCAARPFAGRATRRPAPSRALAVATVAASAVALAGCTTTQERSAKLAGQAAKAAEAKRFNVGRTNPELKVADVTRLEGEGSAAVVVRIENRGRETQTYVPIGVDLYDAKKVSLYTNRIDGLDAALNHVPVAPPGVSYWVNNQVPALEAARTRVRIGTPLAATPRTATADLPEIRVAKVKLGEDAGVPTATGVVRNRSTVAQLRLTMFAVALREGRVVAAGRAVVDRLEPGKGKRFSIYFAGDPTGATLRVSAPPSTLPGA